ncbi:MAG: gamma-glutamylcyclotransferase family protein [Verrucomicrobiota bacterium]
MALVFVYGSLKRGFCNHHFLEGQRFLQEVQTLPVYTMYDYGGFPALVEAPPGNGCAIHGELWDIEGSRLTALDWLEDVEEGLYRRATARLPECGTARINDDQKEVIIYLYCRSVQGLPDVGKEWPLSFDLGKPSEFPY